MLISKSYSLKNNISEDKPNEDSFFCDDKNGIYAVFDGVSRDKVNGKYPNPSPAEEVATILSLNVKKQMTEQFYSDMNLSAILLSANTMVRKYNSDFKEIVGEFLAGAVGIICSIDDRRIKYAYIGDCSGFILRKNQVLPFTKKQTLNLLNYKGMFSTKTIRQIICNNTGHDCGYGVLNGDIKAKDFIVAGEICLEKNDLIVLTSDGCDNIVYDASVEEILKLNIRELFIKYCKGEKKDDRTMIVVEERN